MQISAANLLLASQQPRSADAARQTGDAFAAALGERVRQAAKAGPAQFSPPSFDADAPAAQPAPAAATKAAAAPSAGYGAMPPPGSRLDIRV